jgi:NCS1 family nucleobase:cation symporter-1
MDEQTKVQTFLKFLEVPHESDKHISVLQNPDLEPMPQSRRSWGFWSFTGYWAVLNISIWTWSVGSSLLSLGLNIQHSMGALTIGNIFIVLYTIWNSRPGQTYHIGFTVCQRIIFGIYGSGLGIFIRIVLSIVYYGSQAWLGGLCFVVIFSTFSESYMNMENTFSDSVAMTTRDFIGFFVFQVISLPFFYFKPEKMNKFVNATCVVALIGMLSMFIYMIRMNGGPGPIFHQKVELSSSQTGWMWLYAMTTWYGALSPDITNISDYSRFSSGTKKLNAGVFTGIFFTEIIPLAGLICASISVEQYGEEYWLPTDICMQWLKDNYSPGTRAACFFLSVSFMLSELSLNIVTNGFAGGMDLAGVFPKYIDIKRGAILTALLSWCVQPWEFYNTSSTFLAVMSSFGVIVTPIFAIVVADFTLIRKQRLPLNDLYTTSKDGKFYFTYGVNWRGIFVFVATVTPGLPGIATYVQPSIVLKTDIVNYFYGSIIFSFFVPLILYYIIAKYIFPIRDVDQYEAVDTYNAFTEKECIELQIIPGDGIHEEVITLEDLSKESKSSGLIEETHSKGAQSSINEV